MGLAEYLLNLDCLNKSGIGFFLAPGRGRDKPAHRHRNIVTVRLNRLSGRLSEKGQFGVDTLNLLET